MANISFGERLKRVRIRNAMNQTELGQKVGVSPATISQWENGKYEPSKPQKEELKKFSVVGLRRDQLTKLAKKQTHLALSARG